MHFFTETRQRQYLKLKFIRDNKIIFYNDLILNVINLEKYIENNLIKTNFLSFYYFKDWLIGFTMAEGSFLIKSNLDICFQLKQKHNMELLNNIVELLKTTRKVTTDKGIYNQISVSSIQDIETIIKFFSFSGNQSLLGNKLISYNKWLLSIQNSSRYNKIWNKFISNENL